MLLTMMMKKNMWMFLILGFVLSAYMGLPTLAVALIGAVVAGLYDLIMTRPAGAAVSNTTGTDEEGEYDL